MRISDWSSDVCSSDLYSPDAKRGFCGSFLEFGTLAGFSFGALLMLGFSLGLGEATMYDWGWRIPFFVAGPMGDRKRVVSGKRVSVRVALGGRRIIKKKTRK